jgi:hypothetical protein
MSLELALEKNTAAIEKLVALLANPPVIDINVEDPAPKAKRTKKEAAPEAPAGEPASAPTAEPAASGEPSAPEPDAASPSSQSATTPTTTEPPTYADAAAAVTRVVKELGTPRAKELLAMFGAGNLKEVKPERYSEVIAACDALVDIPF